MRILLSVYDKDEMRTHYELIEDITEYLQNNIVEALVVVDKSNDVLDEVRSTAKLKTLPKFCFDNVDPSRIAFRLMNYERKVLIAVDDNLYQNNVDNIAKIPPMVDSLREFFTKQKEPKDKPKFKINLGR